MSDANLKHPLKVSPKTEGRITEATLIFLEHALSPVVMQINNKKEREQIIALHKKISTFRKEGTITNYKELHATLMPVFQEPKIKPGATSNYLKSLQQSINSIAYVYDTKKKSKPSDKEAKKFLKSLTDIKARLIQRRSRARFFAGFFNDISLYDKKIKQYDIYVNQIKKLIDNKNKHEIKNIDNEIRELQIRMKQDATISTSTARFFKRPSNVTVIKDIQQLSKKPRAAPFK